MSTLAIPAQRVRLYRVLWDRWIIVLRILFDLGALNHPVNWQAVSGILLIDKKTSQKYLAGLAREGTITAAGQGYMLTQAGMDVLLENTGGEFVPAWGENPPLEAGKNSLLSVKTVEVEDIKLNLTTSTTTDSDSREKFSPPESREFFSVEVATALRYLPELFDGADIDTRNLPQNLHVGRVMGWIAYAYDRWNTQVHSPCGLIHSKLRGDQFPPMKYMKDPCAFLPDEYLSLIGEYSQNCWMCKREFTDAAEYKGHLPGCTHQHEEQADATVESWSAAPDATVTEKVRTAWERVLESLREDMPRASFETWVRDTQAVRFEGGTLSVACRNVYARDWLESRLRGKAEGLLTGIMQAQATVSFVVAVETE